MIRGFIFLLVELVGIYIRDVVTREVVWVLGLWEGVLFRFFFLVGIRLLSVWEVGRGRSGYFFFELRKWGFFFFIFSLGFK